MISDYTPACDASPKPARTKALKRFILPSDEHDFIGRIYDLSIISLHFDSYDELVQHADCKYALSVNHALSLMTRRVESLNMAGDLLWPEVLPIQVEGLPINAYQWLIISSDVFLMRYISVADCALILTNAVFESDLDLKKCSLDNLRRAGVSQNVCAVLEAMINDQGTLRSERNSRFHHGYERGFTDDDLTFQTAAMYFHGGRGIKGKDRFGRKINIERFLKHGLVEIQRTFNQSTRILVKRLDSLYNELWGEFEGRFGPRIAVSTHGLRMTCKY